MPRVKRGNNRKAKQQRRGGGDDDNKKFIRKPKESAEVYAKVTRHFGQGNVEVICDDGVTRLCVIRKKFRGRRKRSNEIKVNSILLVGRREWEVVGAEKRQKVDLLFVYSKEQVARLKKEENDLNPVIFAQEEEEGFEFSKESLNDVPPQPVRTEESDDEIDVDDI